VAPECEVVGQGGHFAEGLVEELVHSPDPRATFHQDSAHTTAPQPHDALGDTAALFHSL